MTVALRAMHYGRYGTGAESERLSPLYVGRETLIRSYDIDSFDASDCRRAEGTDDCPELDRLFGSRLAVANLELRVPLVGNEQLGIFDNSYCSSAPAVW